MCIRDSGKIVADPAQMRGVDYTQSSQPWVLKITVKQDLGKWFGRSADGTAVNAADPDPSSLADCYATGGYKLRVNLRSHIFGNNEDEAWFDRLLTAPWDDLDNTGGVDAATVGEVDADGAQVTPDREPFNSSAYYQVYDVDVYEGNAAPQTRRQNVQPFGMDYTWTLMHGSLCLLYTSRCV